MLMTAAPSAIARAMPATESLQRICSGSATLTARIPGQTPRIPTSFLGAAATAAVSVPWADCTGNVPTVEMLPPANSGWVGSSWESISASSGLCGVTGGGTRRGSTIAARHAARASSGSGAGPCSRRASRLGSADSSIPRARSARASERARAARDDVGARAGAAPAVGGSDRIGRPAGRRSDEPGRPVGPHRGRRGVAGQRHGRPQLRGGGGGGSQRGAEDGGEQGAAQHRSTVVGLPATIRP